MDQQKNIAIQTKRSKIRLTFSRNTTSPIAYGIQVQTIPISATAKFNRNKLSGLCNDRFQQITMKIKEFRMIANIVTKAIRIPTTVLSSAIFADRWLFCKRLSPPCLLIFTVQASLQRLNPHLGQHQQQILITKVFQYKEVAQQIFML